MFPQRLKALRKERNLTAQKMADFLGVHLRNYQKYEGGEVQPSMENLVRIADYLDVSLDYLLGRDDFFEKHYRP